MTDHVLHIGTTKVIVTPRFGSHVLGVSELGHPVERVGTFDSPVAASRFVEALKHGVEAEGIVWGDPRPGARAEDPAAVLDEVEA